MRFTPNLIPQWHSTLYRFVPSPARLTPIAMEQLSAGYCAAIDVAHRDPLIVIPLAILDFLCIHPFTDGNGRVGRKCAYHSARKASASRC